ncbi:MAG: hypothetical protein ABR962_00970 [Candidatus Bathyarchaeia archaeon]|jgi:hypothetical protein
MAKSVRIVTPFDTSKICVSQNPTFPEAYIVDLPLDSVPDQEWRDAFDLKWKSSRDLWDRKLLLMDDKVRLVTTADGFVEKLEWVEKTIDETNDAIKDQCRIIGKEKEMIREATAKHALQTDMRGSEMIVETLRRRFSM